MHKTTLAEFIAKHGQTGAADRLGMTQPSVRKALLSEREIYVTEHPDGTFTAEEVRPFPSPDAVGRPARPIQ